jgi:DNA invertase Pin-like site-specific DNA recombinase
MTTQKRCRLVAYYRVSTEKQGRSGLGLDAQKATVADHVRSSGCALVGTYIEIETGTKRRVDNRPELQKAMAHAKRSKATLVIAKLDRLSRNVAFISGLMESGVEFIACDNPTANRLTVHILAAVAEDEARRISLRTKDALAAAKARGQVLGSPQNLTREGTLKGIAASVAVRASKRAEAYAHIAPTIKDLHDHGLSLHAIAKQLKESGEETRSGKPWSAVQVRRVLLMEVPPTEPALPFRAA